jgi:SAM-dependent methyltransferase
MNATPESELVDRLRLCPVCGGTVFASKDVLWPELIEAWQLSSFEVAYINRQQGTSCGTCGNNLRAMGLAAAVLDEWAFMGSFHEFCTSGLPLRVLEINPAANLTTYLRHLPGHKLVEYPDFDMLNLAIPSGSYDLVVHSDTLEHVPNPVRGLAECRRVLKHSGKCIFTVPVIVDRISRNRAGLAPSFHGRSDVRENDQIVHTEFGVDFWKTVIGAGFKYCGLYSFEYPAALAVIAKNLGGADS